jgi:hypothetical protein
MSRRSPESTLPPPESGSYGPPSTPEKKRSWPARHKILTTLGAGAGLIAIISVASHSGGQGSNPPAANQPSASAAAKPVAAAGIGTPVRDGKFEFVVTGVTHAKSVGGEFGSTAQGEYTILHVSVKNIGDQSQTLDDSSQYVFNSAGAKYDADSVADMDANGDGSVFLENINPGNSVQGQIAFDMPSGTHAVKAELHDSMFSNGVTVNLG